MQCVVLAWRWVISGRVWRVWQVWLGIAGVSLVVMSIGKEEGTEGEEKGGGESD